VIQVNGDPLDWRAGMTVRDVLVAKNFKFPLLVITIDGTLVDRKAYNGTAVPDEADVQVIHMISGG
jgi:thiamine biosynthesis protein ThiS